MNLSSLFFYGAGVVCGGFGLFVLFRDRQSFVHRTYAAGMILLALESVFNGLSLRTGMMDEVSRWQSWRLITASLIPGVWILFSLSFARTNYREVLGRIKWVILLSFILPLGLITLFKRDLFRDVPIQDLSNQWLIPLGWAGSAFFILFLLGIITILMNLERTLRASTGQMRWQIKFMVIGLISLFVIRIYTTSQILLFRLLNTELDFLNTGALLIACALMARSLARVRIFNVNFYLSHSLLYNSFTVLFVGIYFIVVGLLAQLVRSLDLTQYFPLHIFVLFLAFVMMAVLILSDRARYHMKRFINHHFSRPIFDYRKEWANFTEKTAHVAEVKDLCYAVARMVSETLEALAVTVWLVNESKDGLTPCGSTAISETQIALTEEEKNTARRLYESLKGKKMPIDMNDTKDLWVTGLIESHPGFFERWKLRYCVPLIAGGELEGLLTVSDRVGKIPFGIEEFDLLKTISDQTASSLMNLRLSEHLRQVKELEAFQTMSSFVVHDLKNLASTLSLTVQNLPIHFDNPAFREDALRVISQSVSKIRGMCSQLSTMSQRIDLKTSATDLNKLIVSSLSCLNGPGTASIVQQLQAIPMIQVDPTQIQKVITNLILNANEAIRNGGEIRIATGQNDGWVVFSVEDTGCGMSREFVERSLFRPFKTTKKEGMGIGLFQSKMIVEAHGGRMEVQSEVAKGSTFKVFLPIHNKTKD